MYNEKHNSTNKNLEIRNDLFCQFCGKQLKNLNSLKQHEIRCANNPQRIKTSETNLSNRGWSKGLTKETDIRLKNHNESIKNYYKTRKGTFTGKHHSTETKERMSQAHLQIDHANCNHNSHGKRGYKDGIFFMSSYELTYYLYTKLTTPDVTIERCTNRYKYIYKGKNHYYTPDFIINKEQVIEVKGWETELDRYKYTLVDNLVIVKKDVILPMMKVIKDHYGVTDICSLYDVRYDK